VFDAGDYRRERHGAKPAAAFFEHANPEYGALRRAAAVEALGDLLAWQRQGSQIGIFDGEPGGPSTRIEQRKDAYGDAKWFVAVSGELTGMDKTQRTALSAADIGTHQGLQQGQR